MSDETREKILEINSTKSTVTSVAVWSLVTLLLGALIDNQATVREFLLSISPDKFDPVVDMTFAYFIALILLFVGPRQKSGAVASKLWR